MNEGNLKAGEGFFFFFVEAERIRMNVGFNSFTGAMK